MRRFIIVIIAMASSIVLTLTGLVFWHSTAHVLLYPGRTAAGYLPKAAGDVGKGSVAIGANIIVWTGTVAGALLLIVRLTRAN